MEEYEDDFDGPLSDEYTADYEDDVATEKQEATRPAEPPAKRKSSAKREEFAVERLQATNAQLKKRLGDFKQLLQSSLEERPKVAKRKVVTLFGDAVAARQVELAHRKLRSAVKEIAHLRSQVASLRSKETMAERVKELESDVMKLKEANKQLEATKHRHERALLTARPTTDLESELKVAIEQRRRAEAEKAQLQKRDTELRTRLGALQALVLEKQTPRRVADDVVYDERPVEAHLATVRIALDRQQRRCVKLQNDSKKRDEAKDQEIQSLQAIIAKRDKDLRLQHAGIAKLKKNLLKLTDRYHKIKQAAALAPQRNAAAVLATLRPDNEDDDVRIVRRPSTTQPPLSGPRTTRILAAAAAPS